MAMRLSGLMSGMDTDSIIQELVAVRQTKVDTATKAQTKLSWKQEAWKTLNTKLKNLQSKYINNMRWESAYSKKATKVSDDSVVSVITGENAVNGVQALKVSQLAKTGYLTGAQLKNADGEPGEYTALTKLSELSVDGGATMFSGEGTFSVKAGDKEVDINVTADTTISDVLTKLKEAGLNANFDAKNQRFFVSAKESGAGNDFSITASNAGGANALMALGLQVGLEDDKTTKAQYQEYHDYFVVGGDDAAKAATLANMKKLIDGTVADKVAASVKEYQTAVEAKEDAQETIDLTLQKYTEQGKTLESVEYYSEKLDEIEKKLKEEGLGEDTKKELEEQKKTLAEDMANAKNVATQTKIIEDSEAKMTELTDKYITNVTKNEDGTYSAEAKAEYIASVEQSYYDKAAYGYDVIEGNITIQSAGATKVNGQNAVIELNGATFENNTNVFEINGLTFTALSETEDDETVTVTTQNDTDGIYDMVKNFLKEYNSIINEMDSLYNADSAKGYEPLTSDEKYAMSEKEVEDWEKKIKDSLLRRDSSLNSVSSALKDIMSSGFEVNGETMYLSDFGINTLGYFSAPDNEKNAYHIDGDPDDANTSGNADILKGMISSDPDTVISFFTKLSQSLYSKMTDMSKSVDGYRSFGSFYDDKKMQSDYTDYTSKIADLEEKLNDYEDKWYKKFSAMETALAKLQSNTSAITGLLGG